MRELTIGGDGGGVQGSLKVTGPAKVTVEVNDGEVLQLEVGGPFAPAASPGPTASSGPTAPAGPTDRVSSRNPRS